MKVKISIAKREAIMLIDTGATLSLLSAKLVEQKTIIYLQKSVNLIGINGANNRLRSMGLIYGTIKAGKYDLKHEFQIVDNSVKLNADGILGYDFMKKYGVKLDLFNNKIELILPPDHEAYEKLYEELNLSTNGLKINDIKDDKRKEIVNNESENYNKSESINKSIEIKNETISKSKNSNKNEKGVTMTKRKDIKRKHESQATNPTTNENNMKEIMEIQQLNEKQMATGNREKTKNQVKTNKGSSASMKDDSEEDDNEFDTYLNAYNNFKEHLNNMFQDPHLNMKKDSKAERPPNTPTSHISINSRESSPDWEVMDVASTDSGMNFNEISDE